jgi:hypothetical protein
VVVLSRIVAVVVAVAVAVAVVWAVVLVVEVVALVDLELSVEDVEKQYFVDDEEFSKSSLAEKIHFYRLLFLQLPVVVLLSAYNKVIINNGKIFCCLFYLKCKV